MKREQMMSAKRGRVVPRLVTPRPASRDPLPWDGHAPPHSRPTAFRAWLGKELMRCRDAKELAAEKRAEIRRLATVVTTAVNAL